MGAAQPERHADASLEFLQLAHADLEGEGLRPLEHYLARFSGSEAAIRVEYERLQERIRPSQDTVATSSDHFPAGIPRRMGRYELVRELGVGGQGVVFLAVDAQLERRVALKILPNLLGRVSSRKLERLEREAEIVSLLEHPAICTVYEVDLEGPTPFIAMRYAPGPSLADVLGRARGDAAEPSRSGERRPGREAPLADLPCFPRARSELAKLLLFFEEAARALHAAHELGVVHRDVKPSNFIVTPEGRPVLLDFGLAQREDSAGPTLSGERVGTPAYMSPEQIQTGAGRPDRRTDVFSLAVVLYECLTLRRPFEGEGQHGLYRAILESAPPDPRRLNPIVDADLAVLLLTALEKDATLRYATAAELADELRRVRLREPIRARPAGNLEKAWRWARRHPRIAGGTLAAFLLLSASSAISVALWWKAEGASALYRGGYLRESSRTLRESYPTQALAVAILAAEVDPGHAANATLLEALMRLDHRRLIPGRWRAMDFSPTGETLALGGLEGEVAFFDAASGVELGRLAGSTGSVHCLRFTPRGLAAGYSDGSLRLWNFAGDPHPIALAAHEGSVEALELDPSGAHLLSCSTDGTLRLWDSSTGAALLEFRGHTGAVTRARFSADGSRLATASSLVKLGDRVVESDLTVRVFEAASGRELFVLEHGARITDLEFLDERGERLVTCSYDRHVRVHELGRAGERATPSVRAFDLGGEIHDLELGPGSMELAIGHTSGACVLDLASGERRDLPSHAGRGVRCVAWDRDARTLATAALDGLVRFWDADSLELARASGRVYASPLELRWDPNGAGIVLVGFQHSANLLFGRERFFPRELLGHSDAVVSAAFDRAGERLLTASLDGRARLSELGSGRALLELDPGRGALLAASFAPDEQRLLLPARAGSIHLFDARSASGAARVIETGSAPLLSACFSSDGERVLSVSRAGRCVLWELGGDGAVEYEHGAEIECARLSPDGRWLATGGTDRKLRLWLVEAPEHPDERRAAGDPDWEWSFHDEIAEVTAIHDLAFDPGSHSLYVSCQSTQVVRIDLSPRIRVGLEDGAEWTALARMHVTGDGRRLVATTRYTPSVLRADLDPARGLEFLHLDRFFQHANRIESFCVNDRRQLAVTGSLDGTAKVWRLDEMDCWATYRVGEARVGAVAVSGDGSVVVTGDDSGCVRIWPVDLLEAARAALPAARIEDLLPADLPLPGR